jgi:hypothetical protein
MKPAKQWLAAGLVLGMTVVTASMPAQAELLSVQGVGILDTEQNIIWLQDANLLNTLEDTTTASYNALVAAIIAANKGVVADSPDFYDGDSRQYTLTAADFQPGGTATYWGALAFVKYLNITRYRGSNNWTLPRVGGDMTLGYNQTGDAHGKLFYNELRGTAGSAMPVGPFIKFRTPIGLEASMRSTPISPGILYGLWLSMVRAKAISDVCLAGPARPGSRVEINLEEQRGESPAPRFGRNPAPWRSQNAEPPPIAGKPSYCCRCRERRRRDSDARDRHGPPRRRRKAWSERQWAERRAPP